MAKVCLIHNAAVVLANGDDTRNAVSPKSARPFWAPFGFSVVLGKHFLYSPLAWVVDIRAARPMNSE